MPSLSLVRSATVLTVLAGLALAPAAHAQVTLSGIALFSTDASFNFLDDSWNTQGGDVAYDLWTTANGTPLNGPADANASISLSLTPGTYNFSIYGSPGRNRNFHGLNLFFGSNTTTPGITVFAPTAANTTTTAFTVASSNSTPNLSVTAINEPAAGSSFSSGGLTVTLTAYRWEYSTTQAQDVVSPLVRTPDGIADNQGVFTLVVRNNAVPEPGNLALLATSALTGAGFLIRRRK